LRRSVTAYLLGWTVVAVLVFPCAEIGAATATTLSAEQAQQRLAGIDEVVLDGMERFSVPGLAMAVVADGHVVLAKGYGFRDLERRAPMTADTELPIASATKPFTALLMTIMAAEGLVDWHTPVQHYFPGFATDRPTTAEKATPRDLITHRTGIPRHDAVWVDSSISRRELVARLRYLKSNAGLRQRFQYNNLVYVAAGMMLEELTGQTWEELVQARILVPLGMTRTSFSVHQLESRPDHALPYRLVDGTPRRIPFRDVSEMGPASGINSSVTDLTSWVRMNLDRGSLDGRRIVSADALVEMFGPVVATSIPSEHPEVSPPAYGYGWFVEAYRHHLRVYHGGNIDGFTAAVSLLPGDRVGVVVLSNLGNTNLPDALCRTVSDRVLGLDAIDWVAMGFDHQKKQEAARARIREVLRGRRIEGTRTAHALEDYAGEYFDPGYGPLLITVRDGRLEVNYSGLHATLEHWQYETFMAPSSVEDKLANQSFSFRDDLAGEVAAVAVPLEPAVGPIMFKRQIPSRLRDPAFVARLAGTYLDHGDRIEVTLSGAELTIRLPGRAPLTLGPTTRGDFAAPAPSRLTVRFDSQGDETAAWLTVFEPASVRRAERLSPAGAGAEPPPVPITPR
jgi:CubicO group peptidase (beta-lactamase class C family)